MSRVSPSDDARQRARELPQYSRPREGRPVIGRAIPRREAPVVRPPGGGYYPIYPGYPWYGYPWYGYGYPYYGSFGLGFFYYDPYWWGSGTYAGGYAQVADTGSVRLKVKPRDAQVYVDGYFVGIVDSFDGVFQRLKLVSGGHRLEIRLDGYETLSFDVLITPGETITYTGQLKKSPQ